jgi:16S rRNA (guanine527-N7)-methyltransferase
MSAVDWSDLAGIFCELPGAQLGLLRRYGELVFAKNQLVNLVSRRSGDLFLEQHLLPSLAMGRAVNFPPGAEVLDIGTGGGLPGIPLAICFPEARFTLVDSVGKKVRAVEEFAAQLGLKNVLPRWTRAEDLRGKFDFVLGRAVSAWPRFWEMARRLVRWQLSDGNGVAYLNGGPHPPPPDGFRMKISSVSELLGADFSDKWVLRVQGLPTSGAVR